MFICHFIGFNACLHTYRMYAHVCMLKLNIQKVQQNVYFFSFVLLFLDWLFYSRIEKKSKRFCMYTSLTCFFLFLPESLSMNREMRLTFMLAKISPLRFFFKCSKLYFNKQKKKRIKRKVAVLFERLSLFIFIAEHLTVS